MMHNSTKHRRMLLPVIIAAAPLLAASSAASAQMTGFTPAAAGAQRELESRFDAALHPDSLREWMRMLTAQPFYVGSPYNREMAEWLRDRFRAWGFDAEIEEYRVLFPKPRLRELTLLEPTQFRAQLAEPPVPGDPGSAVEPDRLPTYNAYSADGDVTAELVYVNYGVPADYEELERRGIDVRGKIVLARYGGSWRGIKPKVAAEKGAVGAIIYSDPRDDGYFHGDTYPEGPYRPDHGVQRGSVMDLPQRPGDPLTPGYGATADAPRVSREEAGTIMTIPVLPISYADAQPLLAALGGTMAPAAWRGALPLPYRIGPGPARVRLRLEFDWDLAPAYNVIARMAGAELPDEWVVRGNHRDGWAMGAIDPISGLIALMAEAQAIGRLAAQGWRPRRTLIFAGWDAEEPALLGSVEWAEHHADELRRNALVYINTDSNTRGVLNAGGSHTLERMINEIARDVQDPRGENVLARMRATRAVGGDTAVLSGTDVRLDALGSGSDWAAFQQHLGIPSLMLNFGGEAGGGSYHSQYDTFDFYTRFVDPDFAWGVALARVAGRAMLRTAQAYVPPLRFTGFAHAVGTYIDEIAALADGMRSDTERHNRLVADGAYALAASRELPYVPPARQDTVPAFDFGALRSAHERLVATAASYDSAIEARLARGSLDAQSAAELTRALRDAERTLLRDEGLPRRPWYRHQIYAPGFYTGYGVKTLPALREGVEERNWAEARAGMDAVTAALVRMTEMIERGRALVR
ncbi:MAG TPA: transferrin receptor-like dimerization domain-containing protein [Longimicrobiales bacterium]